MSVKKILLPIAAAWGSLGFMRGMQSYEYDYNTYIHKRESYMYVEKLRHGTMGTISYLNPILCMIMAYKEVYRCEVIVRNLEEDKKTEYYNRLF